MRSGIAASEPVVVACRSPSRSESVRPSNSVRTCPHRGHASAYQDDSRGGVWIFDGHAWRFRAGARADDTPGLSFEVTMNRDHNRAILSVGLAYAPLAGAGYDYLLTRETDGWRVRAAYPTWIS